MQILHNNRSYVNVNTVERVASVLGGGSLAILGLRRGRSGIAQVVAGAAMVGRGVTGRCHVYRALGIRTAPSTATLPYELGILARASVTVNRERDQIFQFWRELPNLPRFMQHLVSVEPKDEKRSHWVALGPADRKVEWDAEIINEIPDRLIAWKSLPGGDVDSAGSVRFTDAPGGRGTEVHVELQYNPPGGVIGAYVARLFGREPEQEIKGDLNRLKQFLESGEVATIEGQSRGPRIPAPATVPDRRLLIPTSQEVMA